MNLLNKLVVKMLQQVEVNITAINSETLIAIQTPC